MQKVFSPSEDVCRYLERGKKFNKKDPKSGLFCVRRLFCNKARLKLSDFDAEKLFFGTVGVQKYSE